MNLAHWLERSAQVHPQRPAVAHGTEPTLDYRGLAEAAADMAHWLHGQGASPGERVGLFLDNHPRYLPLLWGIWWAGAVAVPMNARLHPREAVWILSNCGARLCLGDAEHAQALAKLVRAGEADALSGCKIVDGMAMAPPSANVPPPVCPRADDDPAWLFYTSGTTGRPKGVVLTHRNLRWCTMAYTATVQSVRPGDAFLHPAPLSHGSGLYHLPYVMNAGVNVVPRARSLDAAEFFALAAHWRNASTFAAPTIVKRLAQWAAEHRPDTSGLATIVYGGAPMYLADLEAARAALGPHLAQIYGQGESPMTITVLTRDLIEDTAHPRWRARAASVGVAQPMVEVSIRDDDGQPLPTGAPGEVCVRGEVVMAGYWNNPEASAAAIRDGWLWTGDVGMLDTEGFLTLLDRSKDLIISGGNNIYPREIEEVLLTHPAVLEAAVIGRPDAEWGELVVAYVVLRPAATADAAALDAHCLDQMARYKRPKVWRFVAELPKNNYGKVLKTELRARAATEPG